MNKTALILALSLIAAPAAAQTKPVIRKSAAAPKKAASVLPETPRVPFSAPAVQKIVTKSGITAWLIEEKNTPVIAVSVIFKGGSSADPARLQGLSDLVAATLNDGAGRYNAREFGDLLEENGIKMAFGASADCFSASMQTLRGTKEQAFALFKSALTNPRFERKDVRRAKDAFYARIDAQKGSPSAQAKERFFKLSFKNHPYGALEPSKKGLKEISHANMTRYVRERFARDNMHIGVSGNINANELSGLLEKTFADLPARAVLKPVPPTQPAITGYTDVLSRPAAQSAVVFGHKGIPRDDPDFYAAYLVMHVLGDGGFQSRLFSEAREKQGLTYGVSASMAMLKASPMIIGGAQADNAKMAQLVQTIRDVWRKTAKNGITAQELDDAKMYLTGAFPLLFSSSGALASFLASMQYQNLGADYLNERNALFESVTLEQANAAAAKVLTPDNLFFVIIGKPANL